MHSSKKGNQWHFGMKAHIGIDVGAGHVHDIIEANSLLHGVDQAEKFKAGVMAKVEHPFRVIKRQFGYLKTRYKDFKNNTAQMATLFALSNLWMMRSKFMAQGGLRDKCACKQARRPKRP